MKTLTRLRAIPLADRPGTPQRLRGLYNEYIVKGEREQRFIILSSFLCTFAVVRFITHSIRAHRFRWLLRNFTSGGGSFHLHHLVFGILGLIGSGELASGFDLKSRRRRNLLAYLFGASTALTVDEFALWLNLQDVYWAKEGRESVDAAIITAAGAFFVFDGRALFGAMGKDIAELVRIVAGRT